FFHAGELQIEGGQTKEAFSSFSQAAAALGRLVAKSPQTLEYRLAQINSHHYLATLLEQLKRPDEAVSELRLALAAAQRGAADFPKNAGIHGDLGHRARILAFHVQGSKPAEGENLFRLGAKAFERATELEPDGPWFHYYLAATHWELGNSLSGQKRPRE